MRIGVQEKVVLVAHPRALGLIVIPTKEAAERVKISSSLSGSGQTGVKP